MLGEGFFGRRWAGGRDVWDLQDADGWGFGCAVWDWGSVARGVVGDLTGDCGRHVVAFVCVVSVVVVVVFGMELFRRELK